MSNIKYDDTDYLINREESIEYKISDTNVGSIREDKERLMKSLNYELDKIMTRSSKVENATEILNLRQPITYMFLNLLEEREQKDKKIKELEEENKIYALNGDNVRLEIYIKNNYIPVQKVKDLIKNETINISNFECIAVEDLEELLEENK